MSKWVVAAIAAAVVIAVVLVLAINPSSDKKSSSGSSTSTGRSVADTDHANPNTSGCRNTGVDAEVQPLRDSAGKMIGELVLRYSEAREAAWADARNLATPAAQLPVHLRVKRRGGGIDSFDYHGTKQPVFSDMLSVKPGCVWAEAELGDRKSPRARAKTSCRHGAS